MTLGCRAPGCCPTSESASACSSPFSYLQRRYHHLPHFHKTRRATLHLLALLPIQKGDPASICGTTPRQHRMLDQENNPLQASNRPPRLQPESGHGASLVI